MSTFSINKLKLFPLKIWIYYKRNLSIWDKSLAFKKKVRGAYFDKTKEGVGRLPVLV